MPRPLDDGFTQDYPTPALDLMDAMNEIEDLQVRCDKLEKKYKRLKSLVADYLVCDLTCAKNEIDRAISKLNKRVNDLDRGM